MKVLILGLGSIARKHIAALRRINPAIEVSALRSVSPSAKEEGIKNIYSLDEARSFAPDFIIIATPTYLHYENIETCLQLDIPLLIEKPIAHNLQIQSLVPEIRKRGIKTYIACNLRFLDSLKYVKGTFLNERYRINEVNVYCGSYLPSWRPGQDFRKSYSAQEKNGGGVHLDLIHELDYIYWFFGKPRQVLSMKKKNSSLDISAVDYANFILDYDSFAASVILNYFRKDAKRILEIVTNEGTVLVDLLNNQVYLDGKSVFKSEQKIIDTYEDQLLYFLGVIKGERKSFNEIEEALEILNICLQ
ncbi:MAG: Gfo/Idh/MocA family oxidoreductase [Flavobacterium sp.]|nr:MAG: Gfo/Idh/MocA family oxidoreductase [Flavobacterium sp.]